MVEEPKVTSTTALDNLVEEAFQEPVEPVEELDTEETVEEQEPEDSVEEPQESPELEEAETDVILLNDFAKDVGVDIADAYELSVNMPSGQDAKSINQLKNFYLENKDIDDLRVEIKNREEELQVRSEEMRDVPQISNELMLARAKTLSIQDQYNAVNWDAIRQQNPAEWSARQQEFQQAFAVAKEQEALASQTVETQKQQAREFQQERLYEALPELKDETVRNEAAARVRKFAGKFGYTDRDIAGIDDHRLMRMLVEMSKYDGAKKEAKAKIEKTPPKATKTTRTLKRQPTTRKASLQRLKEQAAKTGNKKDIEAFIDAALT